jgi:Flp pilus assembly CpaE family ATPase
MLFRMPAGWIRAFLSKLLVKHSTGVSVLAAPGKFPQFDATNEAIDRLLMVARQDFDNVVIDMGSRLDLMGTGLFKDGSTVYLVIQAGIAGLRNSNRLISQYFNTGIPKLEIVLNRFEPRTMGVPKTRSPRLSPGRRSGRFPTITPPCGACRPLPFRWRWKIRPSPG